MNFVIVSIYHCLLCANRSSHRLIPGLVSATHVDNGPVEPDADLERTNSIVQPSAGYSSIDFRTSSSRH